MQKDKVVAIYRKAVESLYTHTVTVVERETVYNTEKHRDEAEEKIVYKDEPCRISFNSQDNQQEGDISKARETVKLFIRPEVVINNSSKVIANINGNTVRFDLSSPPFIYETHREYLLTYEEEPN